MRPRLNGGRLSDEVATYTTLFSATLADLEERFPVVAEPLAVPRVVQRTNPFTKLPIQVEVFEPDFGPQLHQHSLFAKDGPPATKPLHIQHDEYGRYLRSLVPPRLQSLPHIGTKNVSVSEAHHLLDLGRLQPEKFVQCLPGEGVVEVASTQLVEIIRAHDSAALEQRSPGASEELPLEWFRALLLAPASSRRFLCAWLRV